MRTLRLGSRGSLLAVTQAETVRELLFRAEPGVRVELVRIRTTGDRVTDVPLAAVGEKGVFTKEIDLALLAGEIDLAVHSLKDLPGDLLEGLRIVAVSAREDPRDALVGPAGSTVGLASLPAGARVGTSSLRRRALLLAHRRDLRVSDVRGNLDTRLRKVDQGEYDAVVVAGAGLRRLGLDRRISEWLEPPAWLPAPGQGALAVVARAGDRGAAAAAAAVHDPHTAAAVAAERALLRALEGGCRVPIGAYAAPYTGGLRLFGVVADRDGSRLVRGDLTGRAGDPEALGTELADLLLARGAGEILEEVRREGIPDAAPPGPRPGAGAPGGTDP